MNPQRADGSLGGLLFIVIVIAAQIFNAFRRGKVAQLPSGIPGTSARPGPIPRPAPSVPGRRTMDPQPATTSSLPPKLKEMFEDLSVPEFPTPNTPIPVPAPVPRRERIPESDEMIAAARRMELAETAQTAPTGTSPWARLHLQTRPEWQRAILLSEILQPPVALRAS